MARKTPDRHRCPYCKGNGFVELTGVHAETLTLLRRQTREVNGSELAQLARCPATAMNNRLVALETLGYAIGRRYGRQRLWKATNVFRTSFPEP